MFDVEIWLADGSVWYMYGFLILEEAIHDVVVGFYDNPDDLIDDVLIWSDDFMKKELPVEKFSLSLPPESLTQLEAIAEAEKLPPRVSRSMKIRVAIQRAYEQVMFEKNLLE